MGKDNQYDDDDEDHGYEGYETTARDPGPWFLVFTTAFSVAAMLVVVPLMVRWRQQRRQQHLPSEAALLEQLPVQEQQQQQQQKQTLEVNARNILRYDLETRKILSRAIPFTLSTVGSSTFSNICLGLIGNFVGTHALSAYALVQVLVGLTNRFLYGPFSACTTLCAQAVGAGNVHLAGQYIQLAVLFYLLSNIPMIWFWWVYMEKIILWLEWGDEMTARLSKEFLQVYIFSEILNGVSSGLWALLEITGHATAGTIISLAWGATNALVIGLIVTLEQATLFHVGLAYTVTAVLYLLVAYVLAWRSGWLEPFYGGLFHDLSFKNLNAVKLMVQQAVPLSFGYLASNAEWTVLTVFASHLGPAEVSAWALLGSLWNILYAATSGIGDAAEIRAAYHFGDNNPSMAKLSSYKSLFLSMTLSTIVSVLFLALQRDIPRWFTVDETLQEMLAKLVPYVGIANITMQFGMTSWSLLGAQSKYKLATWVSCVSSWAVTVPLAAFFVFYLDLDLQGVTAATVIGYVSTGAALSFVLLSTDWEKVARKVQERNSETAAGGEESQEDTEEVLYASIKYRSRAANAAARRNIKLVTIRPGEEKYFAIGNKWVYRGGCFVIEVDPSSPLYGLIAVGDAVLAVNGRNVTKMRADKVTDLILAMDGIGCHIALASGHYDQENDEDDAFDWFQNAYTDSHQERGAFRRSPTPQSDCDLGRKGSIESLELLQLPSSSESETSLVKKIVKSVRRLRCTSFDKDLEFGQAEKPSHGIVRNDTF